MAKIKKKGTAGATQNYYTRTQALRKLQISLPDFRRLCIFKGIYPREPRSKKKVSSSSTPSTTFYYAKDIHFLLHEPLLAKFRAQKALSKKISKALGRGDVSDAQRWERDLAPRIKLDHIIKERYPTFVDALRDLDDALTLLFLFANLPSTAHVPAKVIARCQRLTLEFEHYIIRTASLRKSFLSIKGIYYQAIIHGQDVLWLVPYKFVQRAGAGEGMVDFRIMATFVEFYASLLGFVNFRLFTEIGLIYPPRLDREKEEMGAELGALKLEGKNDNAEMDAMVAVDENGRAQEEADRLLTVSSSEEHQTIEPPPNDINGDEEATTHAEETATTTLDTFAPIDSTADTLLQPSLTADPDTARHLFEPFTFFLSRETPRHPLEFILRSFGCKRIGWSSLPGEASGSYCAEDDERITHQVVDRPDLPLPSPPDTDDEEQDEDGDVVVKKVNERVPGRIYIQPQWIWDSINMGQLLRPDLYAPGATLPPHLSPWVKARKGEYDPTITLAEQETVEEAEAAAEEEEEEDSDVEDGSEGEEVLGVMGDDEAREREEELVDGDSEGDEDGGMDVQLGGSDDDGDSSDEAAMDREVVDEKDDFAGFSGSEDEADLDTSIPDNAARQAQAELEAEALGHALPTRQPGRAKAQAAKEAARAKRSKAEREEKEDVERRKGMMSNKKRKMFEKMTYSNQMKDERAEKLRAKRRRVEKASVRARG